MSNEFLRHTLATISFRFQKALEGTDDSFGGFRITVGSRTPAEIIHQASEMMGFTRQILLRQEVPDGGLARLPYQSEIERFHNTLAEVEFLLKGEDLSLDYAKRLLQGPLADILGFIGQIGMLNSLAKNQEETDTDPAASNPAESVPADQVLEA